MYINPTTGLIYAGDVQVGDRLATDIETLNGRQNSAWGGIKSKRDAVKAGGVLVNLKWFHTDEQSRIQQLGLVLMGANIPANLQWKTMDGSFVTMTQTLANQIFSAIAANEQAIFTNAETHRANMLASATPETYDFSTGWPATYA